MEGGTTTAVQGALEVRATVACRSDGGPGKRGSVVDVQAASTFDAENSDPAANIGALTMTALAFDRQRRLLGEVDALDSTNRVDRHQSSQRSSSDP